jgi:8-oxo-dGTP pyrophosphatase MutT (NUDIX family)
MTDEVFSATRTSTMTKMKIRGAIQYAALPYHIGEDGSPQIMLLTSRETRRWVIPKGWAIKDLKPHQVAAREAFEEAGLVGRIISKKPIGSFHYEKLQPEHRLLCEVWVFLLWVDHQLNDWPEKGQRETRWFEPEEAACMVDESGLAEIIRQAMRATRQ